MRLLTDSEIDKIANAINRFQTLLENEIKRIEADEEQTLILYSYETLNETLSSSFNQIERVRRRRNKNSEKTNIKKFKEL